MAAYQANFTGANGTLLSAYSSDSGHSHTRKAGDTGTILINNNEITGDATGTSAFYYTSYTPPSADYELELAFNIQSTLSFVLGGGLRCETDGDGIFVIWDGFSDVFELYKQVGGSSTSLDTAAPGTGTHTIRIVASGGNVEWFLNGVSQGSFSLGGDLSAAGTVGFTKFSGTSTSADQIRINTATVTESGGAPIEKTLTPATETDTAQALSFEKPIHKTLTPAAETGTAQALTATKPIHKTLGPTAETDTAQPLATSQANVVSINPATDTTTSQPLAISKHVTLEPPVLIGPPPLFDDLPTDLAQALTAAKHATLTPATSADQAQTLGITHPIIVTLTPATELDAAASLSISGGLQPPVTNPPTGGTVTTTLRGGTHDQTPTGGAVTTLIRGGLLTAPLRSATPPQPARGGQVTTPARGGTHDETPTGGEVY